MGASDDWWAGLAGEKNIDELTAKAFEEMTEMVFIKRHQVEEQEEVLKQMVAELKVLEQKVVGYLQEFGKTKHSCSLGTLTVVHRENYKIPQGEGREAFFNYLKEKGLFDDMITVNSQRLNAFAKAEMQDALDNKDLNFRIPGLGEPTAVDTLSVRKVK